MPSIILCYAREDESFALFLAEFLSANLRFAVSCTEAVVGPELDLIEATELALSADVALVLLSPYSIPKVWSRPIWEPVFLDKPKQFLTHIGFVLVGDCKFPALLSREHFFDASIDAVTAAREIKRWLLRPDQRTKRVAMVDTKLEEVRFAVADRPGTVMGVDPKLALQFARDCSEDFEAVYCFDCRGLSPTGIVGEIGSALGLRMSGRLEQNYATLSEWGASHRALFVIAGVRAEDRDFATPGGLTSVIFTAPLTEGLPSCIPSRVGDAVRGFHDQMAGGDGIRLGWLAVRLLRAQERFVEALELLDSMAEIARHRTDKPALLEIERERYWLRNDLGYDDAPVIERPVNLEWEVQLPLPFPHS